MATVSLVVEIYLVFTVYAELEFVVDDFSAFIGGVVLWTVFAAAGLG